jgi:hypothetical protein
MIRYSLLLNGRATGATALVKNKIAHALASSSEYSANNAWNVNFNNGNVNNNNKYNNNYVRAVAAFGEEEITGWIEAFDDCCKKKKSSSQCTFYRSIYEEDLLRLINEIESREYEPSVSVCFIVTRPKLREVFAANFRDRIVQHWVCLRLNPLFEERFRSQGNVSFNCREGFGTLMAVQALKMKIEKVTQNYTGQAYIGKFDLCSFFMTIDKAIMTRLINELILTKYDGPDKETLIYLSNIIINHEPQKNCIRKGNVKLWDCLPKNKSLFGIEPGVGMPIGNLTSQLFANYYMSFFDEWILSLLAECGGEYIRFVDDFVVVIPTTEDFDGKDAITRLHKMAAKWLKDNLHLSLHDDKVYIQEAKKGVKFIGSFIKPGRDYTSNRSVSSFLYKLSMFESFCFEMVCEKSEYGKISVPHTRLLEHDVDSLNSYLGTLVHTDSYGIRAKAFFSEKLNFFWKLCYVKGHLQTVKLKKPYRLRNKLIQIQES